MGERIVSVAAGERDLVRKLEAGAVLHVPDFGFTLSPAEQALLNPALSDPKRKNISLEPNNGALHGVLGGDETQAAARALISRYQQAAAGLLARVLPEYQGKTRAAPTSLRLVRVEDRKTSWRKDDSRLHVDAFPSRPTYGERILRVFCNINPAGEPRVWRVGEPFEDMAKKMLPRVPAQWPGSAALLAALKITKRKRSGYDHIMLHLHDAMKADLEYQRNCPQETVPFAPGGAWICFSDHASHAVMSGQFMLEQTLWLPLEKMDDPAKSPLRQLERLSGRPLV